MDWATTGLLVAAGLVAASLLVRYAASSAQPEPCAKFVLGEVTADTLALYSGYDYTKPLLVAVRSRVYDVTKAAAQYGPGGASGRGRAGSALRGTQGTRAAAHYLHHHPQASRCTRTRARRWRARWRWAAWSRGTAAATCCMTWGRLRWGGCSRRRPATALSTM